MDCSPGERINSFALVSYIPDPLGSFLDRMRRELIPSCCAKSHVTILPPRSLKISPEEATEYLTEALHDFAPFSLTLTDIEVFERTGVIYLGIGAGTTELKRMHDYLNKGLLKSEEFHPYYPHLTLAKDFPPQELADMERLAKERWATFPSRRSYEVDRLTFVQNTDLDRWLDLAYFPLGDTVSSVTR